MTRSQQFGVALGLCLIAYWGCKWWSTVDPLPPVAEIVSFEARIFRDQHTQTYHYSQPMFAIPAEHWTRIIDALQPSQLDYNPLKWAGLGLLQVKTKDGRTVIIVLHETHDGPGAFSIEKAYYRGGKTEKIRQVLYEAQTASSPVAP